jgi:mannose-6-phosphate isomerase-like protein (cupin superfamily)
MQISKKHQSSERKNSDVCVVTTYSISDETIDFAIAKISGRYPETKRVTNYDCKEIIYVHEGSGKVVVEGQEHALSAGDTVLIEAGEKYYWEGDMHLFISCRPAWTIEQHQTVE